MKTLWGTLLALAVAVTLAGTAHGNDCRERHIETLSATDQAKILEYIEGVGRETFLDPNLEITRGKNPSGQITVEMRFAKNTPWRGVLFVSTKLATPFSLDENRDAFMSKFVVGLPAESDKSSYNLPPDKDIWVITPRYVQICTDTTRPSSQT
ncbi:MAG: hypothetical protein AAB367_03050 [Patescibacteria group bacterium]